MKNIAIVTINDYANIGNRLQNLAVQTILKNRYNNINVETIRNFANRPNFGRIYYFMKCFEHNVKQVFGIFDAKYRYAGKFLKFNKKIQFSKFGFFNGCNYRRIDNQYDYFVVGSDQIWNPLLFRGCMYNNFLMFTSPSKKITFAPSIALDKIPEQYTGMYDEYLKAFDRIFVREKDSIELVKQFANCPVEATLDPTMFLSKYEWMQFAKNTKQKNRYVLCYFLGGKSESTRAEIDKFAFENDLKVVDISDDASPKFPKYAPDEFIDLIDKAEYVFTDSFHGSVFSFIFHKKFIIFERNGSFDMSSRITSLVGDLDIAQVLRKNVSAIDEVKQQKIDYAVGEAFIAKQKQKYFEYLDEKLK